MSNEAQIGRGSNSRIVRVGSNEDCLQMCCHRVLANSITNLPYLNLCFRQRLTLGRLSIPKDATHPNYESASPHINSR